MDGSYAIVVDLSVMCDKRLMTDGQFIMELEKPVISWTVAITSAVSSTLTHTLTEFMTEPKMTITCPLGKLGKKSVWKDKQGEGGNGKDNI